MAEKKPALPVRSGEGAHAAPQESFAHMFFAKPRPMHVVMLVIFIAFGAALVTQVKLQQADPLETLSEEELVQLLGELDTREDSLRSERRDLEAQIRELDSAASELQSRTEAAESRIQQARIVAGLEPVEGKGIVVGVADPRQELRAQVFVTTLAELRNAGAEAISINEHRVTLSSWFAEGDGGIYFDGNLLESPYTWRVIGNPQTLATALGIRGGAASQMRAHDAVVTISTPDTVSIGATAELSEPAWAELSEE